VRELEKLLELSAVGGNDDVLGIPECLRSEIPQPTEEERQKAQAEAVLAKHNGNLSAAARELGTNRDTVARLTGRRLD
jgi:transcriptional regulator of acetoin/glycerol metabolism